MCRRFVKVRAERQGGRKDVVTLVVARITWLKMKWGPMGMCLGKREVVDRNHPFVPVRRLVGRSLLIPYHGKRKGRKDASNPWFVVGELIK